jgi:glycosyltransferase involved in cell wall biosynthesis
MQRYAKELLTALQLLDDTNWQFEAFKVIPYTLARRFIQNEQGRRIDIGMSRYFKYNFLAFRAKGDVLHVTDNGYADLTLSLGSTKTVVTCHDMIPLLVSKGELSLNYPTHYTYIANIRLRCLEKARLIIADSHSTKYDILKFSKKILADNIQVVPLGVSQFFNTANHLEIKQELRLKLGVPPDVKLILQVGSGLYKNVKATLQALKILNKDLKLKAWLLKVGVAGFNMSEQHLIEELGITNCVKYLGPAKDDHELGYYYKAVDVLAFPSLYEGFGWPPLEAMACGTPVVTSNAGSLPEVVGEAAIMVSPHAFDDLAQALAEVLTKESLAESLKERGLLQAQHFSWKSTATQTLAVYSRLVQT